MTGKAVWQADVWADETIEHLKGDKSLVRARTLPLVGILIPRGSRNHFERPSDCGYSEYSDYAEYFLVLR